MLKSMKKASLFALVGMLSMGAIATTTSPVHAAAPASGETPVVYDNRNVLPDGNGQYGMIIPTAITFTDDKQTADATVEITGINGYDLQKDWTKLEVQAKVKSANSYKLVGPEDNAVAYELKMANNADAFTSNTSEQEITKLFGVGGENTTTEETGTAKLTGKAKVKGQYKDTLTYSFEEITNVLK